MTDTARSAAREGRASAERLRRSTPFRTAARVGFAVNGLLHVLIGVIALRVAFGGGGSTDQSGALSAIAKSPGGVFLLWVIVVGLWALGLFNLLTAALIRGGDGDAWKERASLIGKGIAYLAVGGTAFTFARGSSSSSASSSRGFTAQLLAHPGGVFLLIVVALAVVGIGAYFVVKGAKQKFREDLVVPSGTAGRVTVVLGVVGYIAKGIALAIVGVLFGVAAATSDPSEATGLDGALHTLATLPFGVALLTAVAVGFIAYGVYQGVRARYARL
ncbi:DUF1206 domain-containing protein [Frondihabitans peucedani]|uniref:DUF1206 domain-containing protein n=1 Tax=Frondihabitans peucedani TaxID=598626 RepID=UPI0031E40488